MEAAAVNDEDMNFIYSCGAIALASSVGFLWLIGFLNILSVAIAIFAVMFGCVVLATTYF